MGWVVVGRSIGRAGVDILILSIVSRSGYCGRLADHLGEIILEELPTPTGLAQEET
jgi:hypothetical protein